MFSRQQVKESFTSLNCASRTTPVQYFRIENPDGSNVIGETDVRAAHNSLSPQGWTYVLTHFGTGDRVEVVLTESTQLLPGSI